MIIQKFLYYLIELQIEYPPVWLNFWEQQFQICSSFWEWNLSFLASNYLYEQ